MAEAKQRLLLVDDDEDLRMSLAEALEDAGYAVIQAGNGHMALQLLESELPDLVLLDLLMPVLNGWQFCQSKNENPVTAAIPVIAMSAAVSKDPKSPYYIDVDDFIAKPVELDELLAKISGCLARTALDGPNGTAGRRTPVRPRAV
jgi:two-component system alkaline phosphatase synthesis response regulator PhoP